MKVVILAGGKGTRIQEETETRPKPLVEIGGRPMIWHIMKIYAVYGLTDFVICLGYKGYLIKEFFTNYTKHMADLKIDLSTGETTVYQNYAEKWTVTLIDTGEDTMTGGRLKRVGQYLAGEDFCLTYGDGVGAINVSESISFHRAHGRLATLTAVRPFARFGAVQLDASDTVTLFDEKPLGDRAYVNGGFFVLSPTVLDYIDGDSCIWEKGPLNKLTQEGQLKAYRHDGFWHPMDTLRDRIQLEALWASGAAPWKIW